VAEGRVRVRRYLRNARLILKNIFKNLTNALRMNPKNLKSEKLKLDDETLNSNTGFKPRKQFEKRRILFRSALTPSLSHPMGEGGRRSGEGPPLLEKRRPHAQNISKIFRNVFPDLLLREAWTR